jgi:hypothetical protein
MTARQALTPEERNDITRLVNEYCARTLISDSQLAKNAGVDQPMVHHARQGHLKQRTARLTRLELYIYMENAALIEDAEAAHVHPVIRDVHLAIHDFIAAGGDPVLLSRGIRMLAGASAIDAIAA